MDSHSLLQGNLPDPEIEAGSPALQVDYLPSEPPGNPSNYIELVHGAFQVAQLAKNPPAVGRPGFDHWVGKIPWRRERPPTPVFWSGEFHGLYSPRSCKELD